MHIIIYIYAYAQKALGRCAKFNDESAIYFGEMK